MLSYLVYVSTRMENCTDQDLADILEKCKKNNKHDDITGVLLYSKKRFVQYLEGDQKKITTLYDKIKQDPRHSKVIMLSLSVLRDRNFPGWQMGAKKLNGEGVEFAGELSYAQQEEFSSILSNPKGDNGRAIDLLQKYFA